MAYIITFIFTAGCMHQLQKVSNVSKENIFSKLQITIWGGLSVLIPSVLAGFRSVNIGTDNYNYLIMFEQISLIKSIKDILVYDQELLYSLLNYVVSRFTHDYHWICFFSEFITMIFIVMGFYYFRDKISLSLSILVYLFFWYAHFINIVRQGIALSICFFALRYVIEKKPIYFFIFVAIAFMFHSSAIFSIPIYFIAVILNKKYSNLKILFLFVLLLAGMRIFPILFVWIKNTLPFIRVISVRNEINETTTIGFSLNQTVYRLPVLFATTICYHCLNKKYNIYKYLYMMLLVDIVVVQLNSILFFAYRIGLYYNYASLIAIPLLPHAFKKENKIWVYTLILLFAIAWWIYFTVLNHYGFVRPVYPYESDILLKMISNFEMNKCLIANVDNFLI